MKVPWYKRMSIIAPILGCISLYISPKLAELVVDVMMKFKLLP